MMIFTIMQILVQDIKMIYFMHKVKMKTSVKVCFINILCTAQNSECHADTTNTVVSLRR